MDRATRARALHRCAGLYTGDGTPVRLEAPGGGFNAELQAPAGGVRWRTRHNCVGPAPPGTPADFEQQQHGFTPRMVPNRPPAYWGADAGGAPTPSARSTNQFQRMMQLGIAGLVFFVLGTVGPYVAWVVYSPLPH